MTDLAARGYLDDAAFARRWVEARVARGYGATRLRSELKARGVESALIAAALTALGSEAALERARALARRRMPALAGLRPDRTAARLAGYLQRRGYSAATVARVIAEEVPAARGSLRE